MRVCVHAFVRAMHLRPPAYHKAESFFFRENEKQSSHKYCFTSVIVKIRVHVFSQKTVP